MGFVHSNEMKIFKNPSKHLAHNVPLNTPCLETSEERVWHKARAKSPTKGHKILFLFCLDGKLGMLVM